MALSIINEIDLYEFVKHDDAIFHFCTPDNAKSILDTQTFRLSPLDSLGDPFESAFNFEFVETPDDINKKDESERMAFEIFNSKIQNVKTGSFCSNIPANIIENSINIEKSNLNLKGWQRARMWSQFAKSNVNKGHTGVCLVLSRTKLLKNIHKLNPKKESLIFTTDITYLDKPKQPIFNCKEVLNLGKKEYLKKFLVFKADDWEKNDNNFNRLFSQKYLDYRDANEFRIGAWSKEKVEVDIDETIKGIILGDKIDENWANNFISINNLEILKISFTSGFPSLTNAQ
jgi:hypothetical protein